MTKYELPLRNFKLPHYQIVPKIEDAKFPPNEIYFDGGYDAEWIPRRLRKNQITTIIKPRKEPAEKPRSGEYRA